LRRRFFVDAFTGSTACLTGDAAHHLGRVLRAEPGQLYELSDGNSVFLARIIGLSTDRIDFSLLEKLPTRASPLQISILLSIVKFERFEWALEKATELGVNAIVPLAAARSEKGLVSAADKRFARWRRILLESAQQARCLRPPSIDLVKQAAAAFAESAAPLKVLFSERAAAVPVQAVLKEAASKMNEKVVPPTIALAIGPEGGWTDKEFAAASAAGFQEASLGENILRTDTAVIAGLAAAQLYFQGCGQTPTEGANTDDGSADRAEGPATRISH
jgi:16S rRNA (uracil1498-N3)-methyltransferase